MPARVHILLARDAPVGLIIRRGPSKQVATYLWDREKDRIVLGQWLRGRIYERRSDISPDGKYLIYFAMNGHWKSESRGSWTAISIVPYLKAIVFSPKGDCWNGGGLWTSNRRYWLNHGCNDRPTITSSAVRRDTTYEPEPYFNNECLGVYYPRLIRDGWKMIQSGVELDGTGKHIFEKPLFKGWILRKIARSGGVGLGHGCYWDKHELVRPGTGQFIECADWEWAEKDGSRLVQSGHG